MGKIYKASKLLAVVVFTLFIFFMYKMTDDKSSHMDVSALNNSSLDPDVSVNQDGVIDMPSEFSESPLIEIDSIKINGKKIRLDLMPPKDRYSTRKNTIVANTGKSNISTIEVNFIRNHQEKAAKDFVSVSLRSLIDEKTINISYNAYPLRQLNDSMQFEENISIKYSDYREGFYASNYASSLIETAQYFNVDKNMLYINIDILLQELEASQIPHLNSHAKNESRLESYDISSRFLAGQLFSLQINMGTEMMYEGDIFWAFNNCVIASLNPIDTDLPDNCNAYLAMY